MRVLLIPFSDRPESKAALQVAMEIADRIGANIIGAHLRPHRDLGRGYKTRGLPLFGSPDKDWLEEFGKKSTDSATRRARKSFETMTGEAGFRLARRAGKSKVSIWQEKVGLPDKLMAIAGPVADLTIVTRASASSKVARMFMLAALMNTGRPVLVLPPNQTRAPGKRIAIAWNQSAEVARVVSGCMPLLQAAEQVTIITCGSEGRLGPKSRQLKDYLAHYGIDATVRVTKGRNEEKELLDVYKQTKSDLLFMGAYSRARFREMVFGGMTEYMLSRAKIPVIMLHS
jgi:nucleotide-binding universal stress UspA family protein